MPRSQQVVTPLRVVPVPLHATPAPERIRPLGIPTPYTGAPERVRPCTEILQAEFTVDNGLFTPTLEVHRRAVEARFEPLVDEMHTRLERPKDQGT